MNKKKEYEQLYFNDFFAHYSASIVFQKERTIFPLKYSYVDIESFQEPVIKTKYILTNYLKYTIIPLNYAIKKNEYAKKVFIINKNNVRVTLRKKDTGFLVNYYFLYDSCWKLCMISDESL